MSEGNSQNGADAFSFAEKFFQTIGSMTDMSDEENDVHSDDSEGDGGLSPVDNGHALHNDNVVAHPYQEDPKAVKRRKLESIQNAISGQSAVSAPLTAMADQPPTGRSTTPFGLKQEPILAPLDHFSPHSLSSTITPQVKTEPSGSTRDPTSNTVTSVKIEPGSHVHPHPPSTSTTPLSQSSGSNTAITPVSLQSSAATTPKDDRQTSNGVIDLTEDIARVTSPSSPASGTMTNPTAISDAEVEIDEQRSTTVPNRHMCFGMIQTLVVTLYPRQMEYLEGVVDKVIVKRTTIAKKASLSVQWENGDLYGYVVSEMAETLVPLIDANLIWWEAHVPRQRKYNNVSVPVNIVVYGRSEHQMAVAKGLWGKAMLMDPVAFDHRTRYCNPLVPEPGEMLSPYDRWRGIASATYSTTSHSTFNGTSMYGYSGYSGGVGVRSAEEIKNQIDNVFKGLRSATDLPEICPSKAVTTPMYRHQKQGLYFLMEREKEYDFSDDEANKLTSLWRVRHLPHRHPVYFNVVTSQESAVRPVNMRGGILADDMGLGKTLTIIALIMTTLVRPKKEIPSDVFQHAPDFLGTGEEVTVFESPPSPTLRPLQPTAPRKPLKRRLTNAREKSHGTLIVCPLSTVQNWEEQFGAHLSQASNTHVYVYHGGTRVSDPKYLAQFDVVITTYNLLGSEYSRECKGREIENGPSKHPSALQSVDWFRVVLDEAHIIKEANTVQSRAACALRAERRWCLTGTPIQNKLDDLYALVKFLGMEPFNDKSHWTHFITKPIKSANPIGVTRLQTLMKVITLRRTKTQLVDGKPILSLPSRTDHKRLLDLSMNERSLYHRMESRAKQTIDEIVVENKIMKNYAHILQAILKLRQICAHYALVKSLTDDLDTSTEFNLAKALSILSLLQESGNDQCNACFNPSTATPIVTRCEHILCPECMKKASPICYTLIQKANANVSVPAGYRTDFNCPQCSATLQPIDLIQVQEDSEEKLAAAAIPGSQIHTRTDENGKLIHSTKVKALLDDLIVAREHSLRSGGPPIKSVVFSQWTSMLDLIEDGLKENRIKFTRLDGRMQRNDRTTAMIDFRDKRDVNVILISLKAGGVGLNLTAAQRVYLMDPHWNPSVESQAIDRIHRLGQTKPVDVIRFIIKDSIEGNILELQKRKSELADMTFSEKLSKQEVLKRRLEELKYLFHGTDLVRRNKTAAVSATSGSNGDSRTSSPRPAASIL
ncbi:hypothetical protein DFQ27_002245 [Actinomortierella ambigua]|uniref:Uncharacterized protein n=1 Tax=Actinomortierella ambigua TaxID=1343610 RepID=A0A9P6U768_9FUNG|nr:hypothetical protein DFQ27_002245 [Actinomortierella ambigua]